VSLQDFAIPLLAIVGGAVGGSFSSFVIGWQQRHKVAADTTDIETNASAKVVEMALDLAKANEERANRLELSSINQQETIDLLREALAEVWDGNIKNISVIQKLKGRPAYEPPGSSGVRGDPILFGLSILEAHGILGMVDSGKFVWLR